MSGIVMGGGEGTGTGEYQNGAGGRGHLTLLFPTIHCTVLALVRPENRDAVQQIRGRSSAVGAVAGYYAFFLAYNMHVKQAENPPFLWQKRCNIFLLSPPCNSIPPAFLLPCAMPLLCLPHSCCQSQSRKNTGHREGREATGGWGTPPPVQFWHPDHPPMLLIQSKLHRRCLHPHETQKARVKQFFARDKHSSFILKYWQKKLLLIVNCFL